MTGEPTVDETTARHKTGELSPNEAPAQIAPSSLAASLQISLQIIQCDILTSRMTAHSPAQVNTCTLVSSPVGLPDY